MRTTDTHHTGLARRYRPRTFADVVGQRHATVVLQRAVANGSVPQQLLFSGSSGLGKTTLARIVAAAALCESPVDGDACAACQTCNDITGQDGFHPDVIEFDAASHGSKEQIRELSTRAATAPMRASKRIYIIDEAHGLSKDAGAAFLKLLEEPPPHVHFFLATTDPEKMLRTNRGRCVEFELVRPTDADLAVRLVDIATRENWTLSDRNATAVLEATDPALGIRGALMTLEKISETLNNNGDIAPDELSTLLGMPPESLVSELTAAVQDCNRQSALEALATLRLRSSDEQIRTALLRWAREELVASSDSAVALWRYETVVKAAAGTHWTDVTVCKIAAPHLAPTLETVAAHVADAEELLRKLTGVAPVALQSPTESELQAVEPASSAILQGLSSEQRQTLREAEVTLEDSGEAVFLVGPAAADAVLAELRAAIVEAAGPGTQLKRRRSS